MFYQYLFSYFMYYLYYLKIFIIFLGSDTSDTSYFTMTYMLIYFSINFHFSNNNSIVH